MKILHLLGDRKLPHDPENTASSGVVNAVLETARAQVELGHQVWVAAVLEQAFESEWHGVRLIALEPFRWAVLKFHGRSLDLRMHFPFMYFTSKEIFDLVIGNTYTYMRIIRAPVRMVTFHTPPNYRGRTSDTDLTLKPRDYYRIAADTDAQLAVSRFVAGELCTGLGSRGNIHVAYNGVDLKRFDSPSSKEKGQEFRRLWGADSSAIVFLYAGAMVEEKGVIHLAQVFASLSCNHQNFHLVVAGGSLWKDAQDEYEANVRSILEEASQRGQAHFLGKVNRIEMPAVFAASDIVMVPSCWQEPFPLVTLEALAAAKPIIASYVGGIPETVTPDVGILVPPGDEPLLRLAMLKLSEEGDLRSKMAVSARSRAQNFSWNTTAQTIDSVTQEVLKHKKR